MKSLKTTINESLALSSANEINESLLGVALLAAGCYVGYQQLKKAIKNSNNSIINKLWAKRTLHRAEVIQNDLADLMKKHPELADVIKDKYAINAKNVVNTQNDDDNSDMYNWLTDEESYSDKNQKDIENVVKKFDNNDKTLFDKVVNDIKEIKDDIRNELAKQKHNEINAQQLLGFDKNMMKNIFNYK